MTLYKYTLYSFAHDGLICEELKGYDEKPKSYMRPTYFPQRVPKESIGKVVHDLSGSWNLYLIERDDERARSLVADAIREDIKEQERKFLRKKAELDEKLLEVSK